MVGQGGVGLCVHAHACQSAPTTEGAPHSQVDNMVPRGGQPHPPPSPCLRDELVRRVAMVTGGSQAGAQQYRLPLEGSLATSTAD